MYAGGMGSNGNAYTWNDKGTTNEVFSKIDWSFINVYE